MENYGEKVTIFDTTLRDGEQSVGISLDTGEKLTIAEQLHRLNVDVLEAGFPVASQGDFEAVEAIANRFSESGPIICGLSRTALKDVDKCWDAIEEANQSRIHIFIATSENHMKNKLKMTPEQVIDETFKAVSHAKQYTDDIEFSPEDASRSNFDFMCKVLQTAVNAGATTLNIPDTVGYALPHEYAERLKTVRERVKGDYVISTHCHDDLGHAVANTVEGVRAGGARQVEVAVNGIGERAGNAALEEVVMAIKTRHDLFNPPVYTGIETRELTNTSKLVSDLTGYPIPGNKAVVGRNAFAHEAGIHQHGMLNDASTYHIMQPEDVGQVFSIELGKHAGKAGFKSRLEILGIPTNNLAEITDYCVEIAERGRGLISDVELEKYALMLNGDEEPEDEISVHSIHTETTDELSTAEISISIGTYIQKFTAENGGQIGAAQKAIQQRFPGYEILGLDEAKSTDEKTASGIGGWSCKVRVPSNDEKNPIIISTYAEDKNLVNAAIKAFISAINCGERIKTRRNMPI